MPDGCRITVEEAENDQPDASGVVCSSSHLAIRLPPSDGLTEESHTRRTGGPDAEP
jgi:hypothetical protein